MVMSISLSEQYSVQKKSAGLQLGGPKGTLGRSHLVRLIQIRLTQDQCHKINGKNDFKLSFCHLLLQRTLLIRMQDHARNRRTQKKQFCRLSVMPTGMQAPPPAMLIERDPLTRQNKKLGPLFNMHSTRLAAPGEDNFLNHKFDTKIKNRFQKLPLT